MFWLVLKLNLFGITQMLKFLSSRALFIRMIIYKVMNYETEFLNFHDGFFCLFLGGEAEIFGFCPPLDLFELAVDFDIFES